MNNTYHTRLVRSDSWDAKAGGLFEQPAYVHTCAAHEGAGVVRLVAGNAELLLLETQNGVLRTVYGYPAPYARHGTPDTDRLADALLTLGRSLSISLSPLDAGAQLAAALARQQAPDDSRPTCVTDLEEDPLGAFTPQAKRSARRALRGGARVTLGTLNPWFGSFYRAYLRALAADPIYWFEDSYFVALADLPHVVVRVQDEHGVAVAALFLIYGQRATYHLAARRCAPDPPPGAGNLAVLAGLRAARERGASLAILGGGRTTAVDDGLFRFKTSMATRVLPRLRFAVADRAEAE